MTQKQTTPFQHSPPVHEAAFRDGRSQQVLREILARGTLDQDRPQAIVQQGIAQDGYLYTMGDYTAYTRRGGRIQAARLSEIDGDLASLAGKVALYLGEDGIAPIALSQVMREERLGHDDYMCETALLDIIHLPDSVLLCWDMTKTRASKLLKAQPRQQEAPSVHRNNPAAALGTLVVPRVTSNHARMNQARVIAESHERLVPIFRHRMDGLPVELAPPRLPAKAA